MKLSIVTSLYNSAGDIEEFHRRASAAARSLVADDYEIVLVNDGSPDDSLNIARRLAGADEHVMVIDLSRNFGQHKALMTGMANTLGAHVFLLDGDLEEEPEWVIAFASAMAEETCDVVYGVQKTRRGNTFDRWSGLWFYRLFNFFSGMQIPENVTNARLMTRRYVDALLLHDEREMFMAGLWHATGFSQKPVEIIKQNSSPSSYTFRRKVAMLVTSVTSFSAAPLVIIFYVGVTIVLVAGVFAAYLALGWILGARPPDGWTSVVASVWLLGGLIILFLGVIGIYLHKIFLETKRRPYTIVREVYGTRSLRRT